MERENRQRETRGQLSVSYMVAVADQGLWKTKPYSEQMLSYLTSEKEQRRTWEGFFVVVLFQGLCWEIPESVQILTISVHPAFRRIKSKEPPCGHQSNYFTWHQHQEKGNRIWDSQTQHVRVVSIWECCTQRERLVHMTKETQCSAL